MPLFTRSLIADYTERTAVDSNTKLEDGANPPAVQIAPDADVFDSVINQWTALGGDQVAGGGGIVKWNSTISEVGGVQAWAMDNVHHAELFNQRNPVGFSADHDMEVKWKETRAWTTGILAYVELWSWKNQGNAILLQYQCRKPAGQHFISRSKYINGAWTFLGNTNIGIQNPIWLRIKRDALGHVGGENYFDMYYSLDGINWVNVFSGQIYNAVHFTGSDIVYTLPGIYADGTAGYSFNPELGYYKQCVVDIAAQTFWPDSPECIIKDSVNCGIGEIYAFNAGIGFIWKLNGATSVENAAGGSIKYKMGYGDNADGSGAVYDVAWQTIVQINANAFAGNYDDHQYLFVKCQFNSNGVQQGNITNFSINGIPTALANWLWWKPAADPLGTFIVVPGSPSGAGVKTVKINAKSLAGLYIHKNDFDDCRIIAYTKVEVDTKTSEFYMRWNPNATGDGYLIVIADSALTGGKVIEVFYVNAGVLNSIAISAPIAFNHLGWDKWRMTIINVGVANVKIEVERWNGVDWDGVLSTTTAIKKVPGYCGFGQVYNLGQPLFDNIYVQYKN